MKFLVLYVKRSKEEKEIYRKKVVQGTWQDVVQLAAESLADKEKIVSISESGYQL